MPTRRKAIYPKRKWLDADKDFLRQHYSSMPMTELMNTLQRTDVAIHVMAKHLGIVGRRWSVNNYQTGSSYKKPGRKTIVPKKVKRERARPVTVVVHSRKKKAKRKRWCDQKLLSKSFTAEGKKLVRVDNRTMVYVPTAATPEEIEGIIKRYSKTA